MLADEKPIEIEGLSGKVLVYPDDQLSSTYYYTSLTPRVARGTDRSYRLALMRYGQPTPERTAVLSVMIDLTLPETDRDEVQRQLLKRDGKSANLKPIPWFSGTASIALRGGVPIDGQPSLLGNNSMLFQKELSDREFSILRTDAENGLGIVYRLSYEGMRPRQNWTVKMNWEKFRKYVEEKCQANFIVINFSSTTTFEELRNKLVFEVEGIDYEGDASFQRVFLSRLDQLFTPLPVFAEPSGGDSGSGWTIGYRCEQLTDIQTLERQANFEFKVEQAVSQTLFIQGSVLDLQEAVLATEPIQTLSALTDPFIRELLFSCEADFEGDGIQRVVVFIRKAGQFDEHLLFESGEPRSQTYTAVYGPGEGQSHEWSYKVWFHDRYKRPLLPKTLESEWRKIDRTARFLNVIPRNLYTLRAVSIAAAEGLWDGNR